MKIAIQPFSTFVSGKGMIQVTHLKVSVSHYELGGRIRGSYELIGIKPEPAADEAAPAKPAPTHRDLVAANGTSDLTPEQAEKWGSDDAYFCRCIAENIGLKPA